MPTNQLLTDEEIVEIERRCKLAARGPWTWGEESPNGAGAIDPYDIECHDPRRCIYLSVDGDWKESMMVLAPGRSLHVPDGSDADFIAHSRTDVERLLQEVARLKAEVHSLRNRLEGNS
jgi:hypothetical protein